MKPLIGIVEWPYFDSDNDKIYEVLTPIVEWIIRSGGRPIGLFPTQIQPFVDKRIPELESMNELEEAELRETIAMCDGIIKPGATRIYPHENKIYEYAYEENIPYLGICAGMQIMKAHQIPYIPNERNDSNITHHTKEEYAHKVDIVKDTLLSSIISKDEIMVNSKHNYHVPDSGNKKVAAYAEDGIIEALEDPSRLFHLGLQWHPELLPVSDENSQDIFGNFVEAAKTYKKVIKR